MSEIEAMESRKAYRARNWTLGAFSTEELLALVVGLKTGHPMCDELWEEIAARRAEGNFTGRFHS